MVQQGPPPSQKRVFGSDKTSTGTPTTDTSSGGASSNRSDSAGGKPAANQKQGGFIDYHKKEESDEYTDSEDDDDDTSSNETQKSPRSSLDKGKGYDDSDKSKSPRSSGDKGYIDSDKTASANKSPGSSVNKGKGYGASNNTAPKRPMDKGNPRNVQVQEPIPPVGTIRRGAPFPNMPILEKKQEFQAKGVNFDVSQEYIAGPNRQINANHTSTLDVSVNHKFQGRSTIRAGDYGGHGQVHAAHPGAPHGQRHYHHNHRTSYAHYNNFPPYGAGQMPIRKQISDTNANVNVYVRKDGDGGQPPSAPPTKSKSNNAPKEEDDDSDDCDECSPVWPMMNPVSSPMPIPMPMPIPYPVPPAPAPCPCPCPCPPPKKKKKKKCCDNKQWNMMSMYGMFTLFQQMYTTWQNQMQEQFVRNTPPPQQYGVVLTNPCQMMPMMNPLQQMCMMNNCCPPRCCPTNYCCPPPPPTCTSPTPCNPNLSYTPNPIFEVTRVQVRGYEAQEGSGDNSKKPTKK